ncbi:MAG: hypothetical protein CFH01_01716 [Alphaproteobacteria bacterium MarineAlpha2_Bin1]|nr:MAG: hypothetical protein CFH01_01716 [Alphaproteobacteria bacterium MarineAlpha2_Bin1]|tara:strand:- start:1993 stop:2205 length:213 start_codon:yes stop_codon:yes gene_type:complete
MEKNDSNEKNVKPSILGASVLFGVIIGTSLSGFLGKFELWIPIFGAVGLILGLYLSKNSEEIIPDKTSKE